MIAVLIIRAYQHVITHLPFLSRIVRSNGASERALTAISGGAGPWCSLWRYGGVTMRGWMPFPSWTDPGPQGHERT